MYSSKTVARLGKFVLFGFPIVGTIRSELVIKEASEMKRYNKSQAAEFCGASVAMFFYWIRVGLVPSPTHRLGKRLYYTQDEIEKIKVCLEKQFAAK